jgi:rhamnopyranosyl-N-acetylglucosaminyl-diphospho-decaprenol beta-1,3/1,4-galactofuranosyltransferase
LSPCSCHDFAPDADKLHRMRVCAVVLTCNRVAMLERCLDHLQAQTRRPDHILVVDNGSTDGTTELLVERDEVEVLRLPENIGGAGGYCRGLEEAFERDLDWNWMLDDDAFPEPECLEALIAGINRAPRHPDLMTSAVRWTDSTLHPMNRPWLRLNRKAEFAEAAASGLALIRAATSVSTLVSRESLARHGFPPAHYGIWIDDIEWTARILREGTGYLVPGSVTVHATAEPRDSVVGAGDRFYFKVRNQLWLLKAGSSFRGLERLSYGLSLIGAIRTYLRSSPDRRRASLTVARGVRDGLRREPV